MSSDPIIGGPLEGIAVMCLGVNMPASATAARLAALGANVTKVEPPGGDPFGRDAPEWYAALVAVQTVATLDLKSVAGRDDLERLLERTDVLITTNRLSALQRLGLAPDDLEARYDRLLQVNIVGHAPPDHEVAGHDLTYQASLGLLDAPLLPRTLIADLAGVERAVAAALALLLGRERGKPHRRVMVALADAAAAFAEPLRQNLTTSGGYLGGGSPFYKIYQAASGWVALAALEPHFQTRLLDRLDLDGVSDLDVVLRTRSAEEWDEWAKENDLPMCAVTESDSRGLSTVDGKDVARYVTSGGGGQKDNRPL
jgi:alpha-methylacyl-CoA racemase